MLRGLDLGQLAVAQRRRRQLNLRQLLKHLASVEYPRCIYSRRKARRLEARCGQAAWAIDVELLEPAS